LAVSLILILTGLACQRQALAVSMLSPVHVHKLYVGRFGTSAGAAYLREKLLARLGKLENVELVKEPSEAEWILDGTASMRLLGYYNSNPRIRARSASSAPVYDAKMAVALEDRQGRSLWSANLKPRFWGSQYVADNVVNQAARRVVETLR
jgi:hypothetical protein